MQKDNKLECSVVTKWIEIELTNYCWMNCLVCPRKKLKNFGFMEIDIFKKVVVFLSKWNYSEIVFSGLGDAFLHKDLFKIVDYLYSYFPNATFFLMTKWQWINKAHLEKILEYKQKWFNISLTFSIFSLNRILFNYLTWWDFYDKFMQVLLWAHKIWLDYSLEFLVSPLTLREIDKFVKFANKLWKDYGFSLVHNWAGSINNKIYSKLFDEKKLKNFYQIRKQDDICEVMKYDYVFINYLGDIYQCSLNYSRWLWKLWNVFTNNLKDVLLKKKSLDYNKLCKGCFYFKYKTF